MGTARVTSIIERKKVRTEVLLELATAVMGVTNYTLIRGKKFVRPGGSNVSSVVNGIILPTVAKSDHGTLVPGGQIIFLQSSIKGQ